MQAAETVYEFGSSPDEDDDATTGQPTSLTSQQKRDKQRKLHNQQQQQQHQQQQQSSNSGQSSGRPTRIAGTNLRPNKTSSTSIDQKLNTSFSSMCDTNYNSPATATNISGSSAHSPSKHLSSASLGGLHEISTSEEQLLIKAEIGLSNAGFAGSGGASGSIGNTSNTSLSGTTNSSRGNISQSGNQSNISASSQKSLGHQQASMSVSSQQQNPNFDSNVISERVKNLATQIYQELKRIISRCNYDEDILSGLMPLIVRVLESLDLALIENQQLQVELELCKDDNEQLVIMFEKEKAAKRAIDKKLIESEYAYEEERQQYQQKIESLDNVVKMYELKAKNASDQATRFEEKEAERKKDYNKLHDRYTELLKSHCDIVERFRQLAGSSEIANLHVPHHQMVASNSELTVGDLQSHSLTKLKLSHDDEFHDKSTASIKSRGESTLKSWNAETELTLEDASLVVIDDMVGGGVSDSHHHHQQHHNKTGDGSSHNESERATSEPSEGEHEKEGENDSIAYTSMEKEFRKLIQENKDLLNTKNALNVVKDDLIADVDRLTNEVSMYEQAVEQLNSTKDQMKQKVSTLDAELRKTKEELEKAKQKIRENNEEGVPYSQRKRFGRAEMAKVLMERNNYKERFMELQDAIRYTELVRANRIETEKRSGLWRFFNNLFGVPQPPTRAILGSPRDSSPVVSYQTATSTSAIDRSGRGDQTVAADALQTGAAAGGRNSTGSIWSTNLRLSSNSDLIVLMDSDLNVDRSRAASRENGGGAGGRLSSDASGYINAYGWSLRASSIKNLTSDSPSPNQSMGGKFSPIMGTTSSYSADPRGQGASVAGNESISFNTKLASLQVPIPQYCRPLTGDSLGMKIWCATAIDLSGGDLSNCTRVLASQPLQDTSAEPDTSGSVVNISSSSPVRFPTRSPAIGPGETLEELEQKVDQALNESAVERDYSAEGSASRLPMLKSTTEMVLNALPFADDVEELSTCVWICSTQHSRSKITIIDIKTKPNELLDSFYVPTFIYCIKSIPGCKPSDLLGLADSPQEFRQDEDSTTKSSPTERNSITLNIINELISTQREDFYKLVRVDAETKRRLRSGRLEASKLLSEQSMTSDQSQAAKQARGDDDDAEISRILDNNVTTGIATLQKLNDFVAHTQPHELQSGERKMDINSEEHKSEITTENEGTSDNNQDEDGSTYYQPISTHLSTVWMGGKDCVLYIHSAIGQWKDCVACVQLRDSILQICHFRGRVFVALADGSLCVFFRNIETKQWDLSQYLQINVGLLNDVTGDSLEMHHSTSGAGGGRETANTPVDMHSHLTNLPPDEGERVKLTSDEIGANLCKTLGSDQPVDTKADKEATPSSTSRRPADKRGKISGVHCLEIANKNLWLGYRNRILIFDPITLKLKHNFNVVPQVDNQIRQLVAMKDGVFICLRSDLTLRLYSSLRPYQHIQNIDIEPVVTRLISPKTFVISHITSMRVADNTLWIGIAHGIILTIPCKLVPQISEAPIRNSETGEFEESPSHLSIARFVPKCDVNNAQISFHGHRDSVKFFVHAHGLILSGGQGYLDFRLDMDDQSKATSDKSHLILWQLPS